MNTQYKNLLIGIFVVSALAILVWALLWISPTIGDEGQTLHVRFTNIDKINPGTRVTFAGQPVGEVSKVREIDDARIETHDGRVFIYDLTLKVDTDVDVYTSDQFAIRTSGLLGERSVDITPMPPQSGQPFQRATSQDVLYSTSGGSVEETFAQLNRLSTRAGNMMDRFTDIFDQLDENHFWDNLSGSVKNFNEIATSINQPELLAETVANVHSFSEQLSGIGEKFDESWEKVDQAIVEFSSASEKMSDIAIMAKEIVGKIERGEGSIGRILMRDDFYNHIISVMHKAETLMDDVNHYGILFHLDKKWQRVRARRANIMHDLCTPQEFNNFFNDEINQVATALSRLEYVVDSSCQDACYDEVILSCEFSRVYADLLRRVKSLEGNLKLYNDQLQDYKEDCCGCR